jgi:hypothetical protein
MPITPVCYTGVERRENIMYRTPYRRAFKTEDGTRMIELLDRTEIPYEEWAGNPAYRVVETREYDENTGFIDPQPEPDFEEPR